MTEASHRRRGTTNHQRLPGRPTMRHCWSSFFVERLAWAYERFGNGFDYHQFWDPVVGRCTCSAPWMVPRRSRWVDTGYPRRPTATPLSSAIAFSSIGWPRASFPCADGSSASCGTPAGRRSGAYHQIRKVEPEAAMLPRCPVLGQWCASGADGSPQLHGVARTHSIVPLEAFAQLDPETSSLHAGARTPAASPFEQGYPLLAIGTPVLLTVPNNPGEAPVSVVSSRNAAFICPE